MNNKKMTESEAMEIIQSYLSDLVEKPPEYFFDLPPVRTVDHVIPMGGTENGYNCIVYLFTLQHHRKGDVTGYLDTKKESIFVKFMDYEDYCYYEGSDEVKSYWIEDYHAI